MVHTHIRLFHVRFTSHHIFCVARELVLSGKQCEEQRSKSLTMSLLLVAQSTIFDTLGKQSFSLFVHDLCM